MSASELDKAVEYTKQFIEAVTPIAKQAYEIGLLTLRIDAVQDIFLAVILLAVAFFGVRKVRADWATAKATASLPENKGSIWRSDPDSHLPGMGIAHFIAIIAAGFSGLVGSVMIINVWLWVKLFSPELWLAHKAVAKLIS